MACFERGITIHDPTEIKQRNAVEGINECKAIYLEILAELKPPGMHNEGKGR